MKTTNLPSPKDITLLTAILSFTIAILVILGWFLQIPSLVQLHYTFAPMQFNTALGFMISSVVILFLLNDNREFANTMAAVLSGLALLTLIEIFWNVNLNIDEIFIKADIVTNTNTPGRMAPNTAISFLMLGLSILLPIKNTRALQFKGLLSSLVFCMGALAFIGYILGLNPVYGWGSYTHMALHTAAAFMLLGVGLSFYFWDLEKKIHKALNINYNPWIIGYAFSLAGMLFLLDISMPLGIAAGVPYILLVLTGWIFNKPVYTIYLAGTSILMTILGYFLSPSFSPNWMVLINRFYAIISIGVVAALIYVLKKRDLKMRHYHEEMDLEIIKRTHELEMKNKQLEEFAYIISNDLREPILTTIAFTKLMEQKFQYSSEQGADFKKFLHYLKMASTKLEGVINQLIAYTSLNKSSNYEKVNINLLVDNVCENLADLILQHKAHITYTTLPVIYGYKKELNLLFYHLIKNAIENNIRAQENEIVIMADKTEYDWTFCVRDHGKGIKQKYLERIFIPFQSLENDRNQKTGMGLNICKKIIELHGGAIWAESVIGKGSKFYFTVPTIEKRKFPTPNKSKDWKEEHKDFHQTTQMMEAQILEGREA
ncbi:sensor histidine kinase [Persicobacter diffluens]|uniref:histidine kinase n=1 Tax=Persicobacter diffluens TaxID=981 RepID=A0AAN4VZZ6_9BACT|nr:hypothetical protein PEDI_31390 [Persicobacter diffluens]